MSELTPEMEKLIDQRVQEALKSSGLATQKQRVAIIASQGKLDAAYPPLIIASTAAAMEMETAIFFTFYGLYILHKKRGANLQVPPIANPAMPIPMPNIIGMLPGMTPMAIKKEELIDGIEVGGAATFLGYAAESSINMFM